jgi:hypothetical protein
LRGSQVTAVALDHRLHRHDRHPPALRLAGCALHSVDAAFGVLDHLLCRRNDDADADADTVGDVVEFPPASASARSR